MVFFFDKIYPEIPVLSVLLKLDLYIYLMGMVRQSNSVTSGGAAIRVVTRGGINVVLVNIAKFLIHGITIQ
jgi:hypothetical protein